MAGAEAIAVLGLISSIATIVDETKKVYDAATNAQGLPDAFRKVAGQLPIVWNILDSAKRNIEGGKLNNDACKGVEQVAKACKENAKKLEELFHKTIPGDDASRRTRYIKAVKVVGKGGKVENLMKELLEGVQLLACERGMKTATEAQQEQIKEAITEVSALLPSVPEHEFQETGFTNTNSGSGTQYNAQGTARQYMSGGGSMTFETNVGATTQHISVSLGPNENETKACLRALFLTDPRDDRAKLITTKGPRVDGTCQWIKSHALYDSWLRSHSQLLWLSGGPGKGKTMLSIFLAEELERAVTLLQNKLFLQYFCDNKDEKRDTAVAVLRGLIFQLLQSFPRLFDHILPTFEIQKESLFLSTSFETLWRIFKNMVCDPDLETTYCVLDGLDECDEASLEMLLGKFRALLSAKPNESSACHLNLLIVSRDLPDCIPELLSSYPRISLDPDADTEINKDIDLFIKAKVKELSRRKQYPEKLRVHVEDVLRDRAQGTFLWIGIVAQALGKYKTTEVEKALGLFPRGLDQLYARILLQIDSDRREIAARILRWVVMAVRPLTLSELSIATETTASATFTRDEAIRDQVSYCGNILVIKKDEVDEKDEVGLIHQSAKDYLLHKTWDSNPELEVFRVKEEVANLEIASKCLDYLESGALENRECKPEQLLTDPGHLGKFPLLLYAVLHWHEHARSLAHSEVIFDLSRPFYREKSQIRTSWWEAYWNYTWFLRRSKREPPVSSNLLHLASYFGILPLAENLVAPRAWINETKRLYYLNMDDGGLMTALMWAAAGGYEAVVRLLLEEGANMEAKDTLDRTALVIAAERGHDAVIRLLLEKGANMEVKDRLDRTALVIAADRDYNAIIRLLLEKGANMEAKDGLDRTALVIAADRDYIPIIRLLLEKGANAEAEDQNGETALIRAVRHGHEAVVQLLLEKGANIEAKNKYGEIALIRAAQYGREVVIQLLLEKGADIEAQDRYGATALIKAAECVREDIVQLLLEKGVDIEARDNNGETALIRAAQYGHEAIVQLLLEKGADINTKNAHGETPLMRAAEFGYYRREALVQLLLEKGADIEVKNYVANKALMWAAKGGYEAVVQLLLENGADIKAKNNFRETALMKVAERGHKAVVQLLLEKRADINATDRKGETALIKALREEKTCHALFKPNYEAVIRLLTPNLDS